MLRTMRLFLLVTVALGFSTGAQAALLDFTGSSSGPGPIVLPEATVTAAGDSVGLFTNLGPGNSVCGQAPNGSCEGDLAITFNFDVFNITLEYGIGNPGDRVTIEGFNSGGVSVGSVVLDSDSGNAFGDLSSLGIVRSLYFADTSAEGAAGYAYGNIRFDRAVAVPLLSTLPLLLIGLLGMVVSRR